MPKKKEDPVMPVVDTNLPFLRNFLNAASAQSEKDLDPLFDLLDPSSDAAAMGQKYVDVIGYNPITYYTKEAADDVLLTAENLLEAFPRTKAAIHEQAEQLALAYVEKSEQTRSQYAYFGLKGKIRNIAREIGEVPRAKLDDIFDELEKKYNLNYQPRLKEPQMSNEAMDRPKVDKDDRGTSFPATRAHPIRVVGAPTSEDDDALSELNDEAYPDKMDLPDDDDKIIIHDDGEDYDEDEEEEIGVTTDPYAFDDEDDADDDDLSSSYKESW